MRSDLIQESLNTLEEFNFNVLVYLHSCFDIAAQKKSMTLLIKILENIDGFRKENADELRKLAASLNACPLIIGEKSKAEVLLNGVIYDRHGIPVITLGSMHSAFLGAYPEKISSKGRIIAEIDGMTLKKARERKNITTEKLAEELKLTRESIYLYEHDRIRAKYEIAKKIENFLSTNLITKKKPFRLFSSSPETQTGLGKKLMLMDFDVSSFNKIGFNLLAKDDKNKVVIKQDFSRHPEKTAEFSEFFNALFAVVSEKERNDFPVVHENELKEITCKKDFLKLLKEKA